MSLFSGVFGNHGYTDNTAVNGMTGTSSASAPAQNQANQTAQLTAGQTVEGKVISSNGDTVQLDIGTGSPVTAKLDHAMDLQEGQNVIFEVKANSSQQITLSPLYTNLTNGSTAINALRAAGMAVNSDTLAMTGAMMDAGMGIDKASLTNMYHTIANFPGHDPVNIIQMRQMGLQISEESVQQFESFKNYETQIGEGMKQIAADIPKMYGELLTSGNEKEAMQFMKAVIDTFMGDITAQGETGEQEAVNQNLSQQEPLQAVVEDGRILEGEARQTDGNLISDDNAIQNQDAGKLSTENNLNSAGNMEMETILSKEEAAALKEQAVSEADKNIAGKETASGSEQPGTVQAHRTENSMEQTKSALLGMLREAGAPEEQIARMAKEPATAREILKMANTLMEQTDRAELPDALAAKIKGGLKNVFLSDGFKNTIQQAVQKQWFLEPAEVADKGTVESLYKRLDQQTRQLTDALSNLARPETALSQDLSNMNQNMNFMNQMNQMYQYVQIPLKMHGGEATGDLFVYSDRKSLAQKDGNVSALLHLDMQNLGMVDVYASMTAGNNVFTRFYLESDEMLDFIEANIHILNERLTDRGYQLTTEMSKHDEKKDLLANPPTNSSGAAPKAVMKYSFDIRA